MRLGRVLIIFVLLVSFILFTSNNTPDEDIYITPKEIIKLTNKYRSSKGLGILSENSILNNSACMKAQNMIDKNYWEHDAPDGTKPWYYFTLVKYEYKTAGENLAKGFHDSKSVVNSWINSPEHEKNLSGKYKDVGICIIKSEVYQSRDNEVLVVAHYGSR